MAQEEINLKKVIPIAIVGVIVILALVFGNRTMVTIPAGHAGVLFKTFDGGIERNNTYGEGFHFIAPWNSIVEYEVRQQEIAETMNVLSSNGLEISVDVSVWFQPKYEKIGELHATIGVDYLSRIIIPSLRSSARSVIGRYTPEEIYSTKRDVIQDEIFVETKKLLEPKNVQVNQALVRSIILPQKIKGAIENKLEQEQQSLVYEFKLSKAKQEAERQSIEAEGKAKANKIISASLTDKILKEKGIEATLKLAESNNTKIVVVGSGKDGLPLILGDN